MAQKAGFLTKEGGSIKTWKKRWCVLKNGELIYSKNQNSSALGKIPLDTAGEIRETTARKDKKKFHCFEIVTPNRTFFINAENNEDMLSWVKELTAERDRVQGKTKPKEPDNPVASDSAPPKQSDPARPAQLQRVGLEDFELLKVIGKGSFGQVLQVRKKDTGKIYAMKVLNKKTIIERMEIEHTRTEKNILQKLVHPFLVNLNYSFQTPDKLFFIMDHVNGGELFFHLQKDKKFSEDRARFYCAEIVLGIEYLHVNGVLYRDLKPENLLLTADGHICMTDFGISKEGLISNDARTSTFCGTPEYLAPEVLEGNPYGKAIDWWSFGTLMYEMLTGLPPFYSQDVQQMYSKIMSAKLNIPVNISENAADLIQKLLERDPALRLQDPEVIKKHPWFSGLDFEKLFLKQMEPPFVPPVTDTEDTKMVDPMFTSEEVHLSPQSMTEPLHFDEFTLNLDAPIKM